MGGDFFLLNCYRRHYLFLAGSKAICSCKKHPSDNIPQLRNKSSHSKRKIKSWFHAVHHRATRHLHEKPTEQKQIYNDNHSRVIQKLAGGNFFLCLITNRRVGCCGLQLKSCSFAYTRRALEFVGVASALDGSAVAVPNRASFGTCRRSASIACCALFKTCLTRLFTLLAQPPIIPLKRRLTFQHPSSVL